MGWEDKCAEAHPTDRPVEQQLKGGSAKVRGRYNRMAAMRSFLIPILLCIFSGVALGQQPMPVEINLRPIDPQEAGKISWLKDIQPLLQAKCSECHSSDERKNEFEVTSVETLRTKGRKDGPGVLAGRPDESAIILRIRGLTKPQMPKGRTPLSEDEVHLLRMWIAAGAKDGFGGAGGAAVWVGGARKGPGD